MKKRKKRLRSGKFDREGKESGNDRILYNKKQRCMITNVREMEILG